MTARIGFKSQVSSLKSEAGLSLETSDLTLQTFGASVRGPFGPSTRVGFGFFLRFADEHDRAVWFAAAVAADPGHPVAAARFAVNL